MNKCSDSIHNATSTLTIKLLQWNILQPLPSLSIRPTGNQLTFCGQVSYSFIFLHILFFCLLGGYWEESHKLAVWAGGLNYLEKVLCSFYCVQRRWATERQWWRRAAGRNKDMGYKKAFCRKRETKQVVRCGGQMTSLSKGFPLGGQQMIFYNLIKPQSFPIQHHCSHNTCCNLFLFRLKRIMLVIPLVST